MVITQYTHTLGDDNNDNGSWTVNRVVLMELIIDIIVVIVLVVYMRLGLGHQNMGMHFHVNNF